MCSSMFEGAPLCTSFLSTRKSTTLRFHLAFFIVLSKYLSDENDEAIVYLILCCDHFK